jgi:hypothetical protein
VQVEATVFETLRVDRKRKESNFLSELFQSYNFCSFPFNGRVTVPFRYARDFPEREHFRSGDVEPLSKRTRWQHDECPLRLLRKYCLGEDSETNYCYF